MDTLTSCDTSRHMGYSNSSPYLVLPAQAQGHGGMAALGSRQHPMSQAHSRGDILQNQSMNIATEEQDDLDCNVLDDEEEALDAIKAVQASQAQKLKENNMRVFMKISHVERQLLEVTAAVEQAQQEVGMLAKREGRDQEALDQEITLAKSDVALMHQR